MRTQRSLSLITFSGLDGAGKSTQIQLLVRRLTELGLESIVLWTRAGYTPGCAAMKSLARRLAGRRLPAAGPSEQRSALLRRPWVRRIWLIVAFLDLVFSLLRIRLLRHRGRIVMCDRYLDDSLIDFHLNFAFEQAWLERLMAWIAPRPDAAFLLLIPVPESLRRSDVKREPFRDGENVLERRLGEYQRLADRGRYRVIDGTQGVEAIAVSIADAVGLPR